MFKDLFRIKKEKQEEKNDEIMKILDSQFSLISLELENLKKSLHKIGEIEKKVAAIEELLKEQGIIIEPKTLTSKTKETIQMILRKYGKLTAEQVGKLLNISRTRANEYLKEMEEEKIVTSEMVSRKKYYKLRQ